jgi:hypothetical protein
VPDGAFSFTAANKKKKKQSEALKLYGALKKEKVTRQSYRSDKKAS